MANEMPESFAENPLVQDIEQDADDHFNHVAPMQLIGSCVQEEWGAHRPLSAEQRAKAKTAALDWDSTPNINELLDDLRDGLSQALPSGCAELVALQIAWEIGQIEELDCYFPHARPTVVAAQVMLRVMDPTRVDQKNAGSCGPAAFAVVFIRHNPIGYARCMFNLLKTGKGTIGTLTLAPHEKIRTHDILKKKKKEEKQELVMARADWVFLASLRNGFKRRLFSRNAHVPSDFTSFGETKLDRMYQWGISAGFPRVIAITLGDLPLGLGTGHRLHPRDSKEKLRHRERPLLQQVIEMLHEGWVAILQGEPGLAHAAEDGAQGLDQRTGSHYMVLESLAFNDESQKTLSYTVTTWTETLTNPEIRTKDFLARTEGLLLLRGVENVD